MDEAQAIEIIRRSYFSEHADVVIEHLLPSARIYVEDESTAMDVDGMVSHFGGLPTLPKGSTWPVWDKREFLISQATSLEEQFKANPRAIGLRDAAAEMRQQLGQGPVPLWFLGQVSLREIASSAPLPKWPRDGTLLFFYEPSAWGFDPLARGHSQALYLPPGPVLVPMPPPSDLPAEARFPRRAIRFQREWTLPTRISRDDLDVSVWGHVDYSDLCDELTGIADEKEPVHRCGGHAQEVQGEMRLECQLVSNGIYCGDSSGYQDPRRALLEKGAMDWQLVIQIDSDEKRLGWMWGDAGRVYFWARWQDIEAADFENSWAILQCY